MITLKGERVNLRALEPEDLEFIHTIENDESIWEISNTITPFSKYVIKNYLENAFKDIFEVKQLRLVIATKNDVAVGLIDVFDFDFKNRRAGVGILLKNEYRKQGFASEALKLLINYCFTHLQMHQLYCNITVNNTASIKLFQEQGFELIGVKKDWILTSKGYTDEHLYQLITNNVH